MGDGFTPYLGRVIVCFEKAPLKHAQNPSRNHSPPLSLHFFQKYHHYTVLDISLGHVKWQETIQWIWYSSKTTNIEPWKTWKTTPFIQKEKVIFPKFPQFLWGIIS